MVSFTLCVFYQNLKKKKRLIGATWRLAEQWPPRVPSVLGSGMAVMLGDLADSWQNSNPFLCWVCYHGELGGPRLSP